MLRGARIPAEWVNAPGAADIRRADNQRMLEALLAPVEPNEDDQDLVARLIAERSPEEIAAALVQAHRARLPEPEELLAADAGPPVRGPRPGFEGAQWFRMNVGRNQNADPRWILPLLARKGHLGRGEIGAIRIAANETLFEVPEAAAARFIAAVRRSAQEEDDGVEIIAVEGTPREEGRQHRRDNARPQGAKPFRPGGAPGRPAGPGGPGGGPRGPRKPGFGGPGVGGKGRDRKR
jgi:ATP-dependent RNA helicase DeaD